MEEESKIDINYTKEATSTTKTLFYYSGDKEKPPNNTVYLRIYGHPLCIET